MHKATRSRQTICAATLLEFVPSYPLHIRNKVSRYKNRILLFILEIMSLMYSLPCDIFAYHITTYGCEVLVTENQSDIRILMMASGRVCEV